MQTLALKQLTDPNPRHRYLLKCGLEELEHYSNNPNFRTYRLSSRGGCVLRSQIDGTNIFYPIGAIEDSEIDWILQFREHGEVYMEEEHQKLFLARKETRFSKIHKVRFYHIRLDEEELQSDASCRIAGERDFTRISKFMKAHYPDTVFCKRMLDTPFAVAEADGEIVATAGVTYLSPRTKRCQVGNFLTHPGYRKQGWGRRVGQHLMNHLSHLGISELRLEVYDHNPACFLYEALGFSVECVLYETMISSGY